VNRVELSAKIVEKSAQRFTPAGLPALDLILEHEMELEELGRKRQVKLSIKALVMGEMVKAINDAALGTELKFLGFLVSPKSYKTVIFHIQEVSKL
jgi:primosomal replication protein N